jgi:hypothetical protein
MHQLAGTRTGALRQIILLAQDDRQPSTGRIARYPGAVDAAANHKEIDNI